MMKKLTFFLVMIASVAFGQSDTTTIKALINANFPDNASKFITPARLRNVSLELMRSGANLQEVNTFENWAVFEDAVTGEDSIKSDVGFYVWDGAQYVDVTDGASNWQVQSDTLKPISDYDYFLLRKGGFKYELSSERSITTYENGDTIVRFGGILSRFGVVSTVASDSASISVSNGNSVNVTAESIRLNGSTVSNSTSNLWCDTIASSSTIALGDANNVVITGSSQIDSISVLSGTREFQIVTIEFTGDGSASGMVDGENIRLSSTYFYIPNDFIQLQRRGSYFYEVSRSANGNP